MDELLFGGKLKVKVTGYGNDGMNEGFCVELHSENWKLQTMIDNIPVPHITISVAKGARPYRTRFLEFHPIESFKLDGIFWDYYRGELLQLIVCYPGYTNQSVIRRVMKIEYEIADSFLPIK